MRKTSMHHVSMQRLMAFLPAQVEAVLFEPSQPKLAVTSYAVIQSASSHSVLANLSAAKLPSLAKVYAVS